MIILYWISVVVSLGIVACLIDKFSKDAPVRVIDLCAFSMSGLVCFIPVVNVILYGLLSFIIFGPDLVEWIDSFEIWDKVVWDRTKKNS